MKNYNHTYFYTNVTIIDCLNNVLNPMILVSISLRLIFSFIHGLKSSHSLDMGMKD